MSDYKVHDLEVRRTFAGCLVTNRCAPITLTHEEARSLAVFLLSGIDDRPSDLEGEFNSALTAMGDPFLDDPTLEEEPRQGWIGGLLHDDDEDYHPRLPSDLEAVTDAAYEAVKPYLQADNLEVATAGLIRDGQLVDEHDRLAQEDSDRTSDSPWEYQAGRIPHPPD